MTNRDILNALGDIDESYITEANGRIKSKKGIIIRYSAMAACLLIAAAGAFAAVKMIPRGKMKNSAAPSETYEEYDGNVADYDGDYSTIDKSDGTKINEAAKENGASSSENDIAYVKRWDEMTNTEKFPTVKINGTEYSVANRPIPSDKIGNSITRLTVLGRDGYTNSEYAANVEVYEIKGISSECAAAVKYDADGKYYVCRNSHYKPETLGQFMNDLSLKENLTFVSFGGTQMKNGKAVCDVEYTNADKAKVWELLFTDTAAKAVKDYDSMNFETAAGIAIDLKLLGYENISLAVTRDGYLTTNILDTGKAFYIGKPAAEKFLSYLEKDCKTTVKQQYSYSEPASGGGSGNSASYSVSHSVGSN